MSVVKKTAEPSLGKTTHTFFYDISKEGKAAGASEPLPASPGEKPAFRIPWIKLSAAWRETRPGTPGISDLAAMERVTQTQGEDFSFGGAKV